MLKLSYDITNCRLFQQLLPVLLLEAHQDGVAVDEDGALDQHAVGGQQMQLLLPGHSGQLVLQTQIPVDPAAGVEEFLQLQPAFLLPAGQLLGRGVLLLDMAGGEVQGVVGQPFLRLLAGGAGRVFDE